MINNDYLYTSIHSVISDFSPVKGSTYLFGYSPEERSHCVDTLMARFANDIRFVKIAECPNDIILDELDSISYNLRSTSSIIDFLKKYSTETLYIDVTGLNNRICASILNNSLKAVKEKIFRDVKVVYVEPSSYKIQQFKSEGYFNDLSEKIDGIEPLPGFATIIPEDIDDVQFVALLGFEGGRFTHLLENVQPPKDNVIPIIGVPGFRMEYPFLAYWGNHRPLETTETWRYIEYAAANSIIEVYLLLDSILKKNSIGKIKLAPIGTKPHAIAAILFAIRHPQKIELVYDNPKRQKQRTEGLGNIVECFVSKLLEEN